MHIISRGWKDTDAECRYMQECIPWIFVIECYWCKKLCLGWDIRGLTESTGRDSGFGSCEKAEDCWVGHLVMICLWPCVILCEVRHCSECNDLLSNFEQWFLMVRKSHGSCLTVWPWWVWPILAPFFSCMWLLHFFLSFASLLQMPQTECAGEEGSKYCLCKARRFQEYGSTCCSSVAPWSPEESIRKLDLTNKIKQVWSCKGVLQPLSIEFPWFASPWSTVRARYVGDVLRLAAGGNMLLHGEERLKFWRRHRPLPSVSGQRLRV